MCQGFLNVIPKILLSPSSLTVVEPLSDVAVEVQSEDFGTVVNFFLNIVAHGKPLFRLSWPPSERPKNNNFWPFSIRSIFGLADELEKLKDDAGR
jgi:hypothetical protein